MTSFSLSKLNPSAEDALLASLLHLCQFHGKKVGKAALVSNLPLKNGRLTPKVFTRAATRAGLKSRVVERALVSIPPAVAPVVLLLKGSRTVIAEKIDGDILSLVDPTNGEAFNATFGELDAAYSGYCIYAKAVEREAIESHTAVGIQDHWFWGCLARSWRIYRDVLIASFMINVFVLANPLFVMNVYDRVVPNNAIETLWALSLGVLILYGFDFVLRLLRTYFIELAGRRADVLLSSVIMERILGMDFASHPNSVGAFASRVKEFETVRNFITSATVTAIIDVPFIVLFLMVVAYIGGEIVWVPIMAIPLILMYAWFVQKRLKKLVAQTFFASTQKNATLVEAISNLETVKSVSAESRVLKKWEDAVDTLSIWGLRWRTHSLSATSFAIFVQQLSSVFVVIVGVYAIAQNELTQGALIACVILVGRALAPLAQMSGLLVQYHQSKLALLSLEEIVLGEQERSDKKRFFERASFEGNFDIKGVEFTYPNEEYPSLSDVDIKIQPGEKVAIIGRMGSGKSTLQKLLIGLYRPTRGAITLDGLDITHIDPANLRENIAYLGQDSGLFAENIRNNIAYGKADVSEERIIEAAKITGVHDFVLQHPEGYERMIGERGELLSGGQRQAICLARTLVSDARILLLDEPTSSMDNASEAKFIARMSDTISDRTLVLVTHKMNLLSLVDRVVVLDAGKVLADGPKDSVLEALQKGQIRVQK